MRQRVRRSPAGHGIARALWTGLATAGMLMVSGAHAVGLGEIRPRSVLNEALVADIPLLDVKGLSATELRVRLAEPAEFARIGVEPDAFLNDIRFELDLSAADPRVRIRSIRPVTEPFLNFLVALEWPQGRLLKEFTLLLDPPADSTVAPPQAAARPAVPESGSRPRVTQVQSGRSTLWRIASEHRPSGSVSVQQTMLAIQRLNPDAFINGNINRLKADQTLQLPDEAEAAVIPASDALEQVARQSDQLQAPPAAQADRPSPIDATKPTAAAEPAAGTGTDGRLEILAGQADALAEQPASITSSASAQARIKPGAEDSNATPEVDAASRGTAPDQAVAGSVEQAGNAAALASPASAALEETDRLSREVVELRAELESQQARARTQLEKRDRQLALLDQRVAALQAEVDRLRSAAAESGSAERATGASGWSIGAVSLSAGLGALVALLTALLLRSGRRGTAAEQPRSLQDDNPPMPTAPPASLVHGPQAAGVYAQIAAQEHPESEHPDERAAVVLPSDQVVRDERTPDEASMAMDEAVDPPSPQASIVLPDADADGAIGTSAAAMATAANPPDEAHQAAARGEFALDPIADTASVLLDESKSAPSPYPLAETQRADPIDFSSLPHEEPLKPTPVPPASRTVQASDPPDHTLQPWAVDSRPQFDDGDEARQPEQAVAVEADASDGASGLTTLTMTDESDSAEEDIDLIAEADIYVAYGRHARAVSLLEVALVEQPERHELRLKLLEVLAQGSDLEAFQAVADTFLALCNEPNLRAEALALQARVAEATDRGQPVAVEPDPDSTHALSGDDIDFSFDWPEHPPSASPSASPSEPRTGAQSDEVPRSAIAPNRSEFDALELALLELEIDSPAERPTISVGPAGPRDEFDFLDEADSAETKLDLARAYREMGDIEGAREILGEVLADGSPAQQQAAREILATLG